jgi:hypothetical protein
MGHYYIRREALAVMKLRSLPDYSFLRPTLSLVGDLGEGAAAVTVAGFMAVGAFTAEGVFMVVGAFVAGGGSQAFTAGAFMVGGGSEAFAARVVSGAFIGATLGAFTVGVSGDFTEIAVFSAMIVFSFPVSMGTRGGGIGVIPIIGVILIIGVIRTIRITHIIRTSQIAPVIPWLRCVPRRFVLPNSYVRSTPTKAIQAELAPRGYCRCPIDGVLGPESGSATRFFAGSRWLARNLTASMAICSGPCEVERESRTGQK